MAKKKQLAGKKTKLAKLPLTQALASQAEEPAPWGPLAATPRQLPFTWEEAQAGVAGPLAALYLHLVRELATLRFTLQPAATRGASRPPEPLPAQVPPASRIRGALRLAREDLQTLHRLLSKP
jgi:hypothetical protein